MKIGLCSCVKEEVLAAHSVVNSFSSRRRFGVCRNIGRAPSAVSQLSCKDLKLTSFFQGVRRSFPIVVAGMALANTVEQGEQEMLKITQQRDAALESVSFMLEGRLAGPWVAELETCWRVVDLTGVTFVDAKGKALLTQMWQQGAQLHAVGCLTRCIVEEITKAGRAGSSCSSRKDKKEGS